MRLQIRLLIVPALLAFTAPLLCGVPAMQIAPPLPPTSPDEPIALEVLRWSPQFSPEEVRAAEERLRANPTDLETRLQLLSHYLLQAMGEPWLRHVFWMVEFHPESSASVSTLTRMSPGSRSSLHAVADYERALALWRKQAEVYALDPRVQRNAGIFIGSSSPAEAEELLLRARQMDPDDPETMNGLLTLYWNAISYDIRPPSIFPARADPAFLAKTRQFLLETTTEAWFPGMVAERISHVHYRDSPEGQAAERRKAEYYQSLMARAREIEPDNPAWRKPLRPMPPLSSAGNRPADNAVAVPTPKVLFEVHPVYPPRARQIGLRGTVRLRVRIGKDGKVTEANLISGHPLMVSAATEAIKQWIFQPTVINGELAEVETVIAVPVQDQ